MRVLVTVTDGNIGCLLAPLLVAHGHEVIGLDTGYYGNARLDEDPDTSYPILHKDLRHMTPTDLAGISNDALGQLSRRASPSMSITWRQRASPRWVDRQACGALLTRHPAACTGDRITPS